MGTIAEILIISVFCVGLRQATEPGFVLNWLDRLAQKLPSAIYRPIIGCPYCMASFWGTIIFWLLESASQYPISLWDFARWPIVCVSCVYMNGVLYEHLQALQKNNSEE